MAVSAKRSSNHTFSIDSLINRHSERESLSPTKPSSITPPAVPTIASFNAHLLKSLYEQQCLESMGIGLNHPAFAGALPSSLPGHIPVLQTLPHFQHLMVNGVAQKDAFLNPWLLARQQQLFPHRFGSENGQGLLMQPFRKPKRIRTAFSPSQLLKLEQAFEKNHYVVGQERKDLASNLGLTETQVKVWFQNRRTKHKRTKDGSDESTDGQNNESGIDDDDLEICDYDDEIIQPMKKVKSDEDSEN